MNQIAEELRNLYQRIPRRHNAENVKELGSLLDEYEDLLKRLELDEEYAKQTGFFFDALDPIRTTLKKSNDSKASKKLKDVLFDEASGALKDSVEAAIQMLA